EVARKKLRGRRRAAPGARSLDADGRLHAPAGEGKLADAAPGGIGDGIGNGGRRRSLRGLAGSKKRLTRPIDYVHVDVLKKVGKAQNGIGAPVAPPGACPVASHR